MAITYGPIPLFVAILCVVSIATIGGVDTVAGSTAAAAAGPTGALETGDNHNETPRHEDPDEYGDDGDLEEMEAWLADSLSDQLGDSAIEISQGEYDLAREHVDDEYRERLDQYVDVAGETDGDGQGDTFEEARDEQERLADATEAYHETAEEYEHARNEGDEDRARELARDLEVLSDRIDDSSASVRSHYNDLDTETDVDLAEPERAVEETNTAVQTDQETVRDEAFVETELVLEPETEAISFLEPLVAHGELRTADGTTLANEELVFEIDNQTVSVETDADGAFTLEYRPTTLPLESDAVTVQYVPEAQSPYLGSETAVPVSVEQVDPEVSDLAVSEEAGYDEAVRVTGSLEVEGIPVDGVPLAVAVDGHHLDTVNTSNGTFDETLSMPVAVPDGEHEMSVGLADEGRALAPASETTSITVEETETELAVAADYDGSGTIALEGGLETADGEPLAGEPVEVRLDGRTLGTGTTASNGSFQGTVSVPEEAEGNATLAAVYEGTGSIGAAEDETALALPSEGGTSSIASTFLSLPVILTSAVALAGLAALARWYRQEQTPSTPQPSRAVDHSVSEAPTPENRTASADAAVKRLLDRATDEFARGQTDAAVRSCYRAVRRSLTARHEMEGALTHWEFYRQVPDDGLEDAEEFRTITESYERVEFGQDGVRESEAATALEHAKRLCEFDKAESPPSYADNKIPTADT